MLTDPSTNLQPAPLTVQVQALERRVAESQHTAAQLQVEVQVLLTAKDTAARQLATTSIELESLRRTHELLEEHAVRLQQDVSEYQRREAEVVSSGELPDCCLERSPSRTLTARLAEMVLCNRPPSRDQPASRSSSAASSPRQARLAGRLRSRPASPPPDLRHEVAVLRVQAELQAGRVAELEQQVAERQREARSLRSQLGTQLAEVQAEREATVSQLSQRVHLAEEAAQRVLALHAAGLELGGSPRRAAGELQSPGSEHGKCREMIEQLHAAAWRERLARQKAELRAESLAAEGSGAAASCGPAAPPPASASSVDCGACSSSEEEMMEELHGELGQLDAEQMRALRRQQADLASRVQALDQHMAGWEELLAAAAQVQAMPPIGPTRGVSPHRTALAALQRRKLADDNALLEQRMKALEGEVARCRRWVHQGLVEGLHTLGT